MQEIEKKKSGMRGEVPEGWKVKLVQEAFQICNNLRFPLSETDRKLIQGEYPYYGPTKIQDYINEYRVDGKYALIGEDGDHFLKWKELPMTLLVSGQFNVNNHAHLVQGDKNLTEWFYYYFQHKELTQFLTRQGAGRYKLTKKALGEIPILLPPLPEQRAIADCLSTWDGAIQATEQLIRQKELQKKWLMQQLLTGKKRLKGFSGEWREMKFDSFLKESRIKGNSGAISRKITVKLYGRGVYAKDEKKVGSANTQYFIRKTGQFIYSKLDFLNGAFGLIPYELNAFESTLDLPCFDLFEDKINKYFFLFYVSREEFYKRHDDGAIGGRKAKRIQVNEFLNIKPKLPPLQEQQAIASILSESDRELDLLRNRLEKIREQKKGLMQVLLTGKRRLRIKEL